MSNLKQKINLRTGQWNLVNDSGLLFFKPAVADEASLPLVGNTTNDARITNDTHHLYVWSGSAWVDQGDILDLTWSAISGKPSSSVGDIDDAVSKKHTQNTDTQIADTDCKVKTDGNTIRFDAKGNERATINKNGLDIITGKIYVSGDRVVNFDNSNLNLFIGDRAGDGNTGAGNVILGSFAGQGINADCVFIGAFAGQYNYAEHEICIGAGAGNYRPNVDSGNICIGSRAGYGEYSTVDCVQNVFIGHDSGFGVTKGHENTCIGYKAGVAYDNKFEGDYNVFIGDYSGYHIEKGNNNTCVGSQSGYNITEGSNNVLLGWQAGYTRTELHNAVIIGFQANSDGGDCVAPTFVGYRSGQYATGTDNTAFGNESLKGDKNAGSTGEHNTCIGHKTGQANKTASYNVFLGYEAGYKCADGDANVFVGYKAGYNETGSNKLYIANSDTSDPLIYGEFDNSYVKVNGSLEVTGELTIKTYSQNDEPTLDTNSKMAIWIDTDDSNRVYLLYRRGSGDQVAVELA